MFHRFLIGAATARFSLSPDSPPALGDVGTAGVRDPHHCFITAFALRGAPAGAAIVVAPHSVVWLRAYDNTATMLVGERARSRHVHATVAFVTHAVTGAGWSMLALPNIAPPWRPRHARPYAYALPRGGVAARSLLDTGSAEARSAANAACDRARMPDDARRVADSLAHELYDADDSVGEELAQPQWRAPRRRS